MTDGHKIQMSEDEKECLQEIFGALRECGVIQGEGESLEYHPENLPCSDAVGLTESEDGKYLVWTQNPYAANRSAE